MSLVPRKRGKFWHVRGTVPARQPDGSIQKVRIERSTRTVSKTRAREIAADFERYYHELAYNPKPKSISFAEAALTYIQTKQKSDRFVTRLIAHFGNTPIDQIDQAATADAAYRLYPGKSAATHSRAVFTPVVAILRCAGRRVDFQRARIDRKSPALPPDRWFGALLPHCPSRLAGLVVFLTLTGRRVGEAISLKKEDLKDGMVTIARTKTGKPVHVRVPDLCLEYLAQPNPKGYTGGDRSKHLFGYHSVAAAHVALTEACKRAKVQRYGFHAIGRHSFATRLLKEGYSLKFVADAGGWASIAMPAKHYAHLEHSEVQDEVRKVGEEWGRAKLKPLGKGQK